MDSAAGIVPQPMPTYVYKFVKTGETIEVSQAFTDPVLTEAKHPRTGRRMTVKKVFTPVGVTFRGNGFYKNDSRSSSSSTKATSSESGSGDSGSSDSGSKDTSKSSSDSAGSSSTSSEKSTSSTSSTKSKPEKKSDSASSKP